MEKITTTKQEIINAFQKWNDDFKANPDEFIEEDEKMQYDSTKQAETLIGYLK